MNKAFTSADRRHGGGQTAEYARSLIEAALDPLVTISPGKERSSVDLDWRRSRSLGLELTDPIKQLDGTIETGASSGSAFTITFEELRYKERG